MIALVLETSPGSTRAAMTSGDDVFEYFAQAGESRCKRGEAISYSVRRYDPDKGLGKCLRIGDGIDRTAWVD